MLEAICKEIALTAASTGKDTEIRTVYFGGGTPSLLCDAEIKALVQEIRKNYAAEEVKEITLEANPDDITAERLEAWFAVGINRLSVGLQTFSDEELRWMNRSHTAAHSRNCLELITASPFTNYSIDLIYGSPLQSDEILRKNIDTILSYNVPHVSCYALTVEEDTALHYAIEKKGASPVSQEKQAEQFLLVNEILENNGYEQYEISNFALPGRRSMHNSSYWQGIAYLGFGPGAHGYDGKNIRRWNVANNSLYLQSIAKNEVPFTQEILTTVQMMNECIMISLRQKEGLDLDAFTSRFGVEQKEALVRKSIIYIEEKTIVEINNCLILTLDGRLQADGISADLFFEENL